MAPLAPPIAPPMVTLAYSIHKAQDIVKFLSPPGSPITVVFLIPALIPNSKGTPSVGAKNTRGGQNLRFSTEIAVYLGNGTR